MAVEKLIAQLAARGVFLSLEGGGFRYRAPAGILSEADKATLLDYKVSIVEYLQAKTASLRLQSEFHHTSEVVPSYSQELWWRAYGGELEGCPLPLNISFLKLFQDADECSARAAIAEVLKKHVALRYSFQSDSPVLSVRINSPEALEIKCMDLTRIPSDSANIKMQNILITSRTRLIPMKGDCLTQATIFILPRGGLAVAMTMNHIIADGVSAEIVGDEIEQLLNQSPIKLAKPIPQFNEYSVGEKAVLDSAAGRSLVNYWESWYRDHPLSRSPETNEVLIWKPGKRESARFVLPQGTSLEVRKLTRRVSSSSFMIYLTWFCIGMARWLNRERFSLKCLGDKRTIPGLSRVVGLMYCADTIDVRVPSQTKFLKVLDGIQDEYARAISIRLPTLQSYPPHVATPDDAKKDQINTIPATVNFRLAKGTTAEPPFVPLESALFNSPPTIRRLPPQLWERPISPIFLHLVDDGKDVMGELQFNAALISPREQERFCSALFSSLGKLYAETQGS